MNPNYVLGAVGSIVTLVFLFEMMRRHRLREKYAVFWVIVALFALLIAVFPALLSRAAEIIGVQVPSNLLFFVASMVLLVVSIQHSHELGRMEDRTRTLAEEVALLRMAQDDPSSLRRLPPGAVPPPETLPPLRDEQPRG